MTNEELISGLKMKFPSAILSSGVYRDEPTITVGRPEIVNVCRFLKDEWKFDSLRDLFGVDMNRPGERFAVVYNLYSLSTHERLRLEVGVDEKECSVPTVTGVWPCANWYERETYDMFGVSFAGHPDLRRIYMPEEFEYFPLRKDFPLMGIPDSLPLPKK